MPFGGRADPSAELSVHNQGGKDHAREESKKMNVSQGLVRIIGWCPLGTAGDSRHTARRARGRLDPRQWPQRRLTVFVFGSGSRAFRLRSAESVF